MIGLGEGDAEGILAVCERWLWALLESDMADSELARQQGVVLRTRGLSTGGAQKGAGRG